MSAPTLTEEQRRKIEENKQRALARRAEKCAPPKNGNASSLSIVPSTLDNAAAKRIVENRQKALERKRGLAQLANQQNHSVNTKQTTLFSKTLPNSRSIQKTNVTQSTDRFSNQSSGLKYPNTSPCFKNTHSVPCLKGKCVLLRPDTFTIDVGYHTALIEFFKQQKTRNYDAAKKLWSFKLEEYDSIMKGLNNFQPDVEIEGFPWHVLDAFRSKEQAVIIPEADLSSVPSGLVNTLKAFQREGVNIAIHRKGRLLLADDMGLGKTLQAICVAAYYRDEWPLLVVAPSSVRFDWAQQICRWLPNISSCDVNVVESSKASASSGLVNIISYDLVARKALELKQKNFKIIIMDESHFLKNFKTVRTKAAMPLLMNAKRVLLLSGTPALSRPSELYCQISAVCPHIFKFHEFGLRYCDAKQLPWGWDYSGSSNMLELQLLLEKKVMIRRQKKDVLSQLPAKTRQMIVLDPRSVHQHKDLKNASKIMDKVGKKGMEKRGALLQYFQETARAKMTAVREYILDLLESDKKTLMFAHHREMLDAVEDCLHSQASKVRYIRIDGSTTSEQRNYFCRKFQTDKEYKLAILSITAANAGLNLSAGNIVVFAELFWNPGFLVQAEDRAHRIGQKDSVSVQYLVAHGTADDYIWPLIQGKLDVLGKAGLTKDDFSNTDTKIMTDPNQRTLLDLFNSDFIDATVPNCSVSENMVSASIPESCLESHDNKKLPNSKDMRTSPAKRQASITNFIQTTPTKKIRFDEAQTKQPGCDDSTDAVLTWDDATDETLTCDDIAAIESFDWDDQI
ncbi:SWI/SNF-related matrix-associated actin-dependent regulator of chromatin subfamily A-like protein 1 [Elysia marginata]|uniref:SWI/SNF-related matrix-associated actin-dependent regulator of chromatin subfamily A-like protein 1 n=1 Tax=Elysia marginata TaxID=1093978 RepID=A0AAV4HQS7_9GAST|nr:SWI/SNF-related matrix-associated actin-dependent regulator of chromatin subfamily A-like protein 1 [Elysia marginata]